jgi:hypothetical protein
MNNKERNFKNKIFYKNGKRFPIINLFQIDVQNISKIKEKISLSFPGYPCKNEQYISSKNFFEIAMDFEVSFIKRSNYNTNKNFNYFKLSIFHKICNKKNKIDPSFIFFKNLKYTKKFLVFDKVLFKKLFFFSKLKNLKNPYELYRFDDFVDLHFENFKKKNIFNSNDKNLEKSFFFSYFILFFLILKKRFNQIIRNFLSLSSIFLLFFFLKKQNFLKNIGFLLFLWNLFFFLIFVKNITLLINFLKNNKFSKKIISLFSKNYIWPVKFYEMLIFFNGAMRTLNLFSN